MKFKELKQEIKELQDKLNSANRVIYRQMQEIKELKIRLTEERLTTKMRLLSIWRGR